MKMTLNCPKSAAMAYFSLGLKHEFETAFSVLATDVLLYFTAYGLRETCTEISFVDPFDQLTESSKVYTSRMVKHLDTYTEGNN